MAFALIPPETSVAGLAGGRLTVREVRCNTLLHPLTYRDSTGYTANLYKGCTHGCVYCYAPSLTHDERKWGTYVDVKVNASQVLERELRGLRKDEVFLSSASDPYQPVEARYGVTRRCLDVLQRHRYPVSILTRSPLVLRDLDLIKRFEWVRVGMSITSVPVRRFEPGVPPLQRRIDTLRRLSKAGVSTWVSLAPVIPGIVMIDLDELFEELSSAGVSSVSFGVLRFAGYEESKLMFESTAAMGTNEALKGREQIIAKLTRLVKQYSMVPKNEMPEWRPDAQSPPSLDGFQ
jgi:DNA repair photolyase